MENVSSAFSEYVNRYGILDYKRTLQMRKDLSQKKIVNFEDEIKKVFYLYFSLFLNQLSKKDFHSYSVRVYESFVEADDLNISKIFRRIFIINQYQKRQQKIKFFNRWKDRIHSFNDNTILSSSLNKFYNPSYNKVTSITKRSISSSRNRIPNNSNEINKKKGSFSSITHESQKKQGINTKNTLSPSKSLSNHQEKTLKVSSLRQVKSDVFQKLYDVKLH